MKNEKSDMDKLNTMPLKIVLDNDIALLLKEKNSSKKGDFIRKAILYAGKHEEELSHFISKRKADEGLTEVDYTAGYMVVFSSLLNRESNSLRCKLVFDMPFMRITVSKGFTGLTINEDALVITIGSGNSKNSEITLFFDTIRNIQYVNGLTGESINRLPAWPEIMGDVDYLKFSCKTENWEAIYE